MATVRQAKDQLSKLAECASKGSALVITRAGRPPVKAPLVEAPKAPSQFGFLELEAAAPIDSHWLAQTEIEGTFGRHE